MDMPTRMQLPVQLRRVQALLAGGAVDRGSLVDDVDALEVFARILEAWDDSMRPMTRAEVEEHCGLGGDPTFDSRFDVLASYGALIQQRLKAGTIRWSPSPIALVSAELLSSLAEEGASDRLADLIILALDRLDDEDLTAGELVATGTRLTRVINVVTAEIHRAVDLGTGVELLHAAPSNRAQRQVGSVSRIVELARTRFPKQTIKLRDLVDAADSFARATDRLAVRLARQTQAEGAAGLFALLSPTDVDLAARHRLLSELASFGCDVVFDSPPPTFSRQGLTDAVDSIGRPPPQRPALPVPDADSGEDPLKLLDRQRERVRRREETRRRWVTSLLAGCDDAVVVDDVWPAPVQRLVDGLAVAGDPTLPVNCDLATTPHVDADASVAVNTPLRLRRLERSSSNLSARPVRQEHS